MQHPPLAGVASSSLIGTGVAASYFHFVWPTLLGVTFVSSYMMISSAIRYKRGKRVLARKKRKRLLLNT